MPLCIFLQGYQIRKKANCQFSHKGKPSSVSPICSLQSIMRGFLQSTVGKQFHRLSGTVVVARGALRSPCSHSFSALLLDKLTFSEEFPCKDFQTMTNFQTQNIKK